MPYVMFVDGMNLAWKAMHAYDLCTADGINTSAIYGFINQLASCMGGKNIKTLVVWDGGYVERTKISNDAKAKGFVKLSYKETRGKSQGGKFDTMNDQLKSIQEFLSYTDIKQIVMQDQEADDVIASYCEKVKAKMSALCLTCDHDYYQIIDDNVSVVSRLKGVEKFLTRASFLAEFGIEPYQWVEVGALCGDDGDCIEGVPGCGETTALEYIKKYQTAFDIIAAMSDKFAPLRAACPDLTTQSEVDSLISLGGGRAGSPIFEGCYPGMPFSGVAMALVKEEIKNVKKIELKFAMYQERIKIARSLKEMNRKLPIKNIDFGGSFKKEEFTKFCEKYELKSLVHRAEEFTLK